MIGQTISHYNILEKIGEGGMGIVYKAEDTKLKRTVALKFLLPEFSRDKDAKDRFFVEAQAAAALSHNNIITIYEINEHENQIYIATEYIEGQNLKDKIESSSLKIDESLKIALQIAEGLQEAHEKGIVHRDIKSANIMITEKRQVKIMDFGLAQLRGQSKLTKAGTTVGTAAYMSPEQSMGKKVDHKTDIWSLGVVLYEMVTGQLPFKGDYEQAVIYSILNEDPEPITSLRTGTPPELERIINKTLVKNPADRYQHADDLMVDLRKLKEDSKPEVSVSRKKTSPEFTIKATRKMFLLGGLILAVIIIAGYLIFKGKSDPETLVVNPGDKPSLAVVYFENKSGDDQLDNWRDALAELIITDLSQSRYLRVLPSDRIFSIFKKLNLLEARKYSTDDLKAIADQGGVNHILKGSYIKAGENFVITSMLQDITTGEIISALKVEARRVENIFSKVDELTREIKSKLKLTSDQISMDIDRDVGEITTFSPEAYNYYSEGLKQDHKLNSYKSIRLMEKAIAIDPEFAMAYRSMALSYGDLGYHSKAKENITKALEFINRVSDREKYQILGDFYLYSEKTTGKAIEAYKKLLRFYPQDKDANINLGALYRQLGQFDKAKEHFEIVIKSKDESVIPYHQLAKTYQNEGCYDKAEALLRIYLNTFPDNHVIHFTLALNHLNQRKFDLALSEIEKALSLAPDNWNNLWLKGAIYFIKGEFPRAEKYYLELLEKKESTAQQMGHWSMAELFLVQGKMNMAIDQLKKRIELARKIKEKSWASSSHHFLGYLYYRSELISKALQEYNMCEKISFDTGDLSTQRYCLFAKGRVHAENMSLDRALKLAVQGKKMVEKGMIKNQMSWYHRLIGVIELKRENYSKAIESFKMASSIVHSQKVLGNAYIDILEPLAFAYYKAGNLEKAQKGYERITSLTTGRISITIGRLVPVAVADLYAKAFYQLGKIYQEKGFKGKAIDSYNKFIELWKECDPIFQPMVEDARKRVKELEVNI